MPLDIVQHFNVSGPKQAKFLRISVQLSMVNISHSGQQYFWYSVNSDTGYNQGVIGHSDLSLQYLIMTFVTQHIERYQLSTYKFLILEFQE